MSECVIVQTDLMLDDLPNHGYDARGQRRPQPPPGQLKVGHLQLIPFADIFRPFVGSLILSLSKYTSFDNK